jgi:TetR/AcrR family fatty acid metabolism transcriptional regulator
MPRSKKWNPNARRKEILDCAVKVLNKKVYYKCPVDEIARYAGIAKGTIYLYFKNKEELYSSVVFNLVDKFISVIDEVNKLDITATKQLSLLLNKMSEFLGENKHLFLSIREESNHPKGKIHEQMQSRFHKITESISRIVDRGIKNKEFKNYSPQIVASVILSITTIFAHKAICEDGAQGLTDSDVIFKILMNGLAK